MLLTELAPDILRSISIFLCDSKDVRAFTTALSIWRLPLLSLSMSSLYIREGNYPSNVDALEIARASIHYAVRCVAIVGKISQEAMNLACSFPRITTLVLVDGKVEETLKTSLFSSRGDAVSDEAGESSYLQ